MLAALVVVVHLAIVVFILAGLPLILIGAWRHWSWVRGFWWRAAHLAAIAFVAAEALAGVMCPLTVLEDRLRGQQSGAGFIERWVDGILFYDLPGWVFTVAYTAFAVAVALAWWLVPPTRKTRAASS